MLKVKLKKKSILKENKKLDSSKRAKFAALFGVRITSYKKKKNKTMTSKTEKKKHK
jgi:hypothetical protein